MPPVCAGSDIIVGMGEIEAVAADLEQLVVDNETPISAAASMGQIPSRRTSIRCCAGRPGGHSDREYALPPGASSMSTSRTSSYEAWLRLGKPVQPCPREVRRLRARWLIPADDVTAKLDEVLRAADRELAGTQ
jgi:hypothetical protein